MNMLASLHSAPVIGISPGGFTKESYLAICGILHHAGVQTIKLEYDPALLPAQLEKVDGVIIMGNTWDIDPRDYGKTREEVKADIPDPEKEPEVYATYIKKNMYEAALVQAAISAKIPLLGVCGGHQRINVTTDKNHPELKAGTLETMSPNAAERIGLAHNIDMNTTWPYTPVHLIKVEPGTELEKLSKESATYYSPLADKLPEGVYFGNSVHNQCIPEGKVRQGFKVAAHSEDGTIESIEADQTPGAPYAGQYVRGVQGHPEFGNGPYERIIINDFVEHTIAYQQQHNHQSAEQIYKEQLPAYLQQLFDSPDPVNTITALFAQHQPLRPAIPAERAL